MGSVENPEARSSWWDRHHEQVGPALARGDSASVKALYRELGDLLDAEFGDDVAAAPQLSQPENAEAVVALLDARAPAGLVLDAGCGPVPVAAIALDARDRSVVGLDLGAGTARLARARAAHVGHEIDVCVGDLEALPFRDGAFAGVACDDTIEHVPDDDRAVAELARVTRAAGCVVLATPNRTGYGVLVARFRDLLGRRRRPPEAYFAANSHLREYTWPEAEALVAGAFDVVERRGVGSRRSARRRVLHRLVSRPPGHRLARTIVLVLRPSS